MRSIVTAIVLCTLAAAAAAECVAQAPAERLGQTSVARVGQAPAARVARPGPELIKSAAAGTPAEADDGLPAISETASTTKSDENHPRRAGSAMLLAAVALMSGIALRRYIARMK